MSFFSKNKIDYEELYKNESQKNNDLKGQCLELEETIHRLSFENSELHSKVQRYKFLYEELENKLKNSCYPIPKKVTPKVKDQVEQMVKNGMTYREIAKQIGISTKTISRIITGYYDNKL